MPERGPRRPPTPARDGCGGQLLTYPRRWPLRGADSGARPAADLGHATLRTEPGGTPGPRRPGLPGRLLTPCGARCGGEDARDYFGGQRMAAGVDG